MNKKGKGSTEKSTICVLRTITSGTFDHMSLLNGVKNMLPKHIFFEIT